ncbi:hypothetical protein [Mycolicibacterium sarraceniae]|uniref:Uncharacterized protein n=1 Tax=Mycolicibacterium sarraceniae TaxID=1534348 RepID=A0A7I7SY39_9MYCO|nr:hypothetical protein [Mycolicibacterium sarraceniae]BBY61109.1 hypothetical protein MSAR_42450 [Mycolicibacterium sarraceniae]
MDGGLRSKVVTGVALLGAGTIALAPVHPVGSAASPLSRIGVPTDVSTANITLAARHDPPERIASWVDSFTNAAIDAGLLGQVHLVDPPPVGRQALTIWTRNRGSNETTVKRAGEGTGANLTTTLPHSPNTASARVGTGSPSGAGNALDNAADETHFAIALPLYPSLGAPGQIATNLSAALKSLAEVNDSINTLPGVVACGEGLTHTIGEYALTIMALSGGVPIAIALPTTSASTAALALTKTADSGTISVPTAANNTGHLPRLSKDSTGSTDAANARPGATAGRAAVAPTRSHSRAGQAGRVSRNTGK